MISPSAAGPAFSWSCRSPRRASRRKDARGGHEPARETHRAPVIGLFLATALTRRLYLLCSLASILKNFRSLHGDETARHHAIEYRQESVDLFLRVDDLNHDRQILREAQDLRCMNTARV